MKKLTKLLALTMTGGMLLAACGDTNDVNDDLPGVEEPADDNMNDDLNDDMDDGLGDDMDEDTDTD